MGSKSIAGPTSQSPPPSSGNFHRAHAEILKMLVTSEPISAVFERIALLVESLFPVDTWCAVARYKGDPPVLCLASAPSIPDEFIAELRKQHIDPDEGTCGKAISQRKTVMVEDLLKDPAYKMFREFSKMTGVRAGWTMPVFGKSEEIIAVLTAFYHQPHRPAEEEIGQVEDLRNLIALAIQKYESDEEFAKTEMRFRSVAAATTDAVWEWDLSDNTIWWNHEFSKLFGYDGENTGPSFEGWLSRIHDDDRERVMETNKIAAAGEKFYFKKEYRFLKTDGTFAHVLDQAEIQYGADGKPARMVGGMSDMTDYHLAQQNLKAINRSFQMLSSCDKILIRATAESRLLDDICHVATGIGGYRAALVAYADHSPEQLIIPAVQVGLMFDSFSDSQFSYSDTGPNAHSPGAQVLRTGKAVLWNDIDEIAPETPWLKDAKCNKIRSLICLPLTDDSGCFGYLGLGSGERGSITGDEQALLQELADNLAFGIISIRERAKQQLTQESIVKVARTFSGESGKNFYQQLTLDLVETLGAKIGIIGKINDQRDKIRTSTYLVDGEIRKNITYPLKGTPCFEVTEKRACLYTENVASLFPDDAILGQNKIEAYAGIALCVDDDKPMGILSVMFHREITDPAMVRSILHIFAERAAFEMAREESDSRIRDQASLLDKARDAIFTCDLDHRILFWNKSSERLYDYMESEIQGKSARELLHPDTASYDIFHIGTLKEGEWVGELRQTDRTGNNIYVESRWSLVRDSQGNPQSILLINTDVTEHRQLERQFFRAQRLESIGTLAGGLAHDLNNILTPISMSAELLRKNVSDPRGTELVEMITSSAARGAQMISQILSFARGIEGRNSRVDMGKVIAEFEPIMRDTFPKTITLKTDIPEDIWAVIGDSTQLHQVMLNLCVNARDAMLGGGTLHIGAINLEITAESSKKLPDLKPGPHVRIRVSDNGKGIAPDIINKIFDPFFTTKSTGKGTGLGLFSVLGILRSHSGIIQANSSPGEGSTFSVFLPAIHGAAAIEAPAQETEPAAAADNEIILIIDDETDITNVISQTLQEAGYQTIRAATGALGLEIFEKNHHDIALVITDMMMPGMDGHEVIHHLLALNPGLAIIGISGIGANAMTARAQGSSVQYFLEKPFTEKILLEAVQNTLHDSR